MSHHGVTTQQAVDHLGLLVRLELHDGNTAYGRVDGADYTNVYLGRAVPAHRHTVELSSLKTVTPIRSGDMPVQGE